MRSKLEAFKKFAQMLWSHLDGILPVDQDPSLQRGGRRNEQQEPTPTLHGA
jgi:hypothetical protein